MALLPPFFIDSLVAFETFDASTGKYSACASGVLVGFDRQEVEGDLPKYKIALVTARHVFENQQRLWVKFNRGDEIKRYHVDLVDRDGRPTWRSHAHFDVAVMPINAALMRQEGAEFSFIPADEAAADARTMNELGVFAGDDTFVLGFPMGLAGVSKKYAVVRGGTIARLDDELIQREGGYWIDAHVYPGNSGGPVVLRPAMYSVMGTKAVSRAYLIGIVSNYLPYQDTAISTQTKRPRVIFEENSGLTTVVPMNAAFAAYSAFSAADTGDLPREPPPPEADVSRTR
jgi:hypothetical protein